MWADIPGGFGQAPLCLHRVCGPWDLEAVGAPDPPVSLGGGTGAGELVARAPGYEGGAVCCQPEPRGPEHSGCRGADETLRVSAARLVTCGYLPLKDCKLLCGIKLKQAALPGN